MADHGHSATDGTCTRDLRLDGPVLHSLSYGGL